MAGTIKTQVQLGDSLTATQNFTLTSEAADGTMKLARGNKGATTQDILTVDSAGRPGFPQLANYANDAAASAGGVPVGSMYRNYNGKGGIMTISLKASADGLSGTIQVGGVDKVTIGGTGITSGVVPTTSYANDAAAAAAGIPVGGLYHTAGAVKIRLV